MRSAHSQSWWAVRSENSLLMPEETSTIFTPIASFRTPEFLASTMVRRFSSASTEFSMPRGMLQNIDAIGTAEWRQRILSAGFRYHPQGAALTIDALYVFNHAEESIGTVNPPVDFLSATQKLDDNGFAFAVGAAPQNARDGRGKLRGRGEEKRLAHAERISRLDRGRKNRS